MIWLLSQVLKRERDARGGIGIGVGYDSVIQSFVSESGAISFGSSLDLVHEVRS